MPPIRTNSGTASSVGSLMATNQRLGSALRAFESKAPIASPKNAKAMAVHAKEKATLYPDRITSMNTPNMVRARKTPASTPRMVSKASTPTTGYSIRWGVSRFTTAP